MKLRENDGRTVEFKLVDRNTNIDFAEDWLNAGALQRDADGAYLVDDIDYIRDYAKDAIKGCNPDVEGKLIDIILLPQRQLEKLSSGTKSGRGSFFIIRLEADFLFSGSPLFCFEFPVHCTVFNRCPNSYTYVLVCTTNHNPNKKGQS